MFHANEYLQNLISHQSSKLLQYLFIIWLFLTVIGPHQDLYKIFFHVVVIPISLFFLATKKINFEWRDPLFLISIVLFIYAGCMTFIVGQGPQENHLRALRWSFEIAFGLTAFFIWLPLIFHKSLWWGRFFILLSFLGALGTITLFLFVKELEGRATGLGALHHHFQIGPIILVYMALGFFLLSSNLNQINTHEKKLIIVSVFFVFLAVILSQSRAAIGIMMIYGLFLLSIEILQDKRRLRVIGGVILGLCLMLLTLHFLFGMDVFIDKLLVRGLSQRHEIWSGYLMYPPDSLLFGVGAGTQPEFHPAYEAYWKPNRLHVSHPHNLFLGTYTALGLLGLAGLITLLGMVLKSVLNMNAGFDDKMRLLGLMALIFMLTFTGSHTIVSSIKAIWIIFWLPLIFIYLWAKKYPSKINQQ